MRCGALPVLVPLLACGLGCGDGRAAPAAVSAAPLVRGEATYEVRVTRDVVYGETLVRDSAQAEPRVAQLTLTSFEPLGAPGLRPAVLSIPGGGFTGRLEEPGVPVVYSASAMVPFLQLLVRRGWVAFAVEYRLADDHGAGPEGWPPPPEDFNPTWYRSFYPAARDCKAALRFVHANARRYSVDPDRIAAIGGSAGASVAILLGLSDPDDFTAEISLEADPTLASTHLGARSDLQAVISYWGTNVPLEALRRFDGRDRCDASDAALAIVHGRADVILPFSHARGLRDACAAASLPHVFHPFDGGHAAWDLEIDGKSLPESAFDFLVEHQALAVATGGR